MLPAKTAKLPVSVHFRDILPSDEAEHKRRELEHDGVVEMTMPVVRNTQLVATFYRPPPPPWPAEIMIAAFVAIVVASAAAAYIARRVARRFVEIGRGRLGCSTRRCGAPRARGRPGRCAQRRPAFNAMNDQVSRTLESQRHLLSAVGHDLRTPITAMRINLEFVEDAELRHGLQKNLDELQELTEAVLSAARGTGGEVKRQIDLAALVESLCADLDDLGESVDWKAIAPAPICCRSNEVLRAVRNLVENAVAYGKKATVAIDD